ncbi:MAG: hypothetical protein JSS14_02310 [Proteobacteria bacterium]|nr:hypothetical protein [Pseudomonadota bacterium]
MEDAKGSLNPSAPVAAAKAEPDSCSVQTCSGLPAGRGVDPGTRVAGRPFGAFTGLELPKAFRSHADAKESTAVVEAGSPGPELPPMRPGLPYTDIGACQELMLAIVAQGLADDDLDYVLSPTFIHHLLYVGLDPDVALKVKIMYLRGEIDPTQVKTALYCQ